MTSHEKEIYYIILDSNMVYVRSLNYNIFNTNVLKNLIEIRNRYNKYFKKTREIKLIFPEIVVKERYNQEIVKISSELKKFKDTIKRLDEPRLITELDNVICIIDKKIKDIGKKFLLENHIEVIPASVEDYLSLIIDKKISNQKPFRIVENKDGIIEKGFCDAIIWYSIINYANTHLIDSESCGIPENVHLIFLVNDKDFRSDDLDQEFKQKTGTKLEIIPFIQTCKNDITDVNFKKLLKRILQNSQNNSIEIITIYYSKIQDVITVTSVYPLPLNINLLSVFSIKNNYSTDHFDEEFAPDLSVITQELLNLGFNLDGCEENYLETNVISVYVNLRDYKSRFIDILDIDLFFADNSSLTLEDFDQEISVVDFEERSKDSLGIEIEIAKILEERGYKNIDTNIIELDVVEYDIDSD
jgi:hypothetical protein